jgi:hypothetical protein
VVVVVPVANRWGYAMGEICGGASLFDPLERRNERAGDKQCNFYHFLWDNIDVNV